MTTSVTTSVTTPSSQSLGDPRRRRTSGQLGLTRREHQVLVLMAEGRSNGAIGEELTLGVKTVETHVSRVFTKLGLGEDAGENRRVLAVLTYLHRDGAFA